jgi:hypothetical protein
MYFLTYLQKMTGAPNDRTSKAACRWIEPIALEVGDIEEALAFYGRLFRFELRSKSDNMAFIDLGDQFIALQKGRRQPADDGRLFGLVVDDKDAAATDFMLNLIAYNLICIPKPLAA